MFGQTPAAEMELVHLAVDDGHLGPAQITGAAQPATGVFGFLGGSSTGGVRVQRLRLQVEAGRRRERSHPEHGRRYPEQAAIPAAAESRGQNAQPDQPHQDTYRDHPVACA